MAAIAPMAITAAIELAKLGLQVYFLAMQTAGKTQEEMEALYKDQLSYFIVHTPSTLPDVE